MKGKLYVSTHGGQKELEQIQDQSPHLLGGELRIYRDSIICGRGRRERCNSG